MNLISKAFVAYSMDILKDKSMLSSRHNVQHGDISVFTHSIMVAKYCYLLNRRYKLGCNPKTLIRGALLHDFFLYDWHDIPADVAREGLHGFMHPMIAARNARRQFEITPKEYSVIVTHMWPLTFTRVPFNREGWLVCMVDKYCSLLETLKVQPYSDREVSEWVRGVIKWEKTARGRGKVFNTNSQSKYRQILLSIGN